MGAPLPAFTDCHEPAAWTAVFGWDTPTGTVADTAVAALAVAEDLSPTRITAKVAARAAQLCAARADRPGGWAAIWEPGEFAGLWLDADIAVVWHADADLSVTAWLLVVRDGVLRAAAVRAGRADRLGERITAAVHADLTTPRDVAVGEIWDPAWRHTVERADAADSYHAVSAQLCHPSGPAHPRLVSLLGAAADAAAGLVELLAGATAPAGNTYDAATVAGALGAVAGVCVALAGGLHAGRWIVTASDDEGVLADRLPWLHLFAACTTPGDVATVARATVAAVPAAFDVVASGLRTVIWYTTDRAVAWWDDTITITGDTDGAVAALAAAHIGVQAS